MAVLSALKKLRSALRTYDGHFAICGGVAASLYRKEPRVTNDIDIALDLGSIAKSKAAAISIIKGLDLTPAAGWIAGAGERIGSSAPLVIGRRSSEDKFGSVDFLLPSFPWVSKAIARAQINRADFGIGEFPVITCEDVIISKLFALMIEESRFADLDDLREIFAMKPKLDLSYLGAEITRLKLVVPKELKAHAPKELVRIGKRTA